MSVLLSAAIIEAGSWVWVRFVRTEQPARWEFRATRPPPYADAAYFGPEFLKESEAAAGGRLGEYLELADFHGRYFNVSGGMRATTGVPARPTARVLMFGGSTLFGQEVPDEHTIASYLQRMLNDAGVSWEVRNYGVPGMNAMQQLRLLRTVQVRRGDRVVFYHGVNEIYYTVFGGYRNGWEQGVPAFRPVQKLGAMQRLMHDWHDRLSGYSFTARVALDIYDRARPSTVTDEAELERNTGIAAERFAAAVRESAAASKAAGADFVHFLQPQVFAHGVLTAYERTLVANPLQTPPGLDTAFRQGYPRLLAAAGKESASIGFHDLSRVLDGRPDGEEVYLDFCHVAHRGNERIARAIFDTYFRDPASRSGSRR